MESSSLKMQGSFLLITALVSLPLELNYGKFLPGHPLRHEDHVHQEYQEVPKHGGAWLIAYR